MMEQLIEQAGLTRTEAKVYYTLLEQGSSLAGRITQKSGIHRRTVYDAIERLIEKGLVSYIVQNNRKYFEAANPKQLIALVKEREDHLSSIMPNLELIYNLSKEKRETVFYRGKLGLKSVFEDQLRTEKDISILGATTYPDQIINYYFPKFDERRIKKKILLKMLFFESSRKKISQLKNCEMKFIPDSYKSDTTIYTYGDKTAIILWGKTPFAIVITQPEIAKGFLGYFSLLWSIAEE